ncbi:MAG: ABC transporter ATP-binding protein [Deltaproteobacteria bacterium]|nr:MAG: ABC transporter ATP-binding protein [Deltaproteobacteria bacterium]
MNKENILINIENVSFSYNGHAPALDHVSFQLSAKEKVGLVGPNGSGKTTLFLLTMGLLYPSSGNIELFGNKMQREEDFRDVRQKIGLLFQDADDQLFCPTVLEDVAFGPLNQGRSNREAKEIAVQTLKSLGLNGFEDRVTHKLSGGEKRLVSLATVLAMKPKVLLLDEPTTGLDADTTRRLISILNSLDLSYILISHDMDFIIKTTAKICGMVNGKLTVEEDAVPHTHVHAHGYGRLPHVHTDSSKI